MVTSVNYNGFLNASFISLHTSISSISYPGQRPCTRGVELGQEPRGLGPDGDPDQREA